MINDVKKFVLETAETLAAKKLTLATAESCTGGGLSYWLTSVPGSSNWFERGYVTYSNDAKMDSLGVSKDTLAEHGAVSEEAAREMVAGVLGESGADLGIAITGIAGPDGGSADKPVGTVFIAWGGKGFKTRVQRFDFAGDRQAVRLGAIAAALEGLLVMVRNV